MCLQILWKGSIRLGPLIPDQHLSPQNEMLFSLANPRFQAGGYLSGHRVNLFGRWWSPFHFREDLDEVGVLARVNMDLIIFTVVFAFDAHPSRIHHLTAMLDASRFLMYRM
jgi:hypothetical protein